MSAIFPFSLHNTQCCTEHHARAQDVGNEFESIQGKWALILSSSFLAVVMLVGEQ
jgi:hypothetical protein